MKIKNVIIISLDCLRADCIQANPDKQLLKKYNTKIKLKTPTLDWFVENGVFFNQCITVAPYTTPAHASILTGVWPYNHGVIDFFRNKLKAPTILSILKKKGFNTLFQTDYPFLLGSNLEFTDRIDKFVVEKEKESFVWLKENENKPLACFFHFASIHSPYGFFNLKYGGNDYRKKVKSLLKKYKVISDIKANDGQHFITGDFTEEEKLLKQNYLKVLDKMHKLGLYDEIMDLYIEGINYFEKNRFRLFIKNLKRLGLLENSLIIIVGDHGETWDRNNKGHGRGDLEDGLAEGIIKVPLIFYGSDLPKGLLNNHQVRTIDVVPTILSILELKKEKESFDGCSLFPFEKQQDGLIAFSHAWHSDSALVTIFMDEVYKKGKMGKAGFDSYLASASVRTDKWKIVQNYSVTKKLKKVRFFNVDKDEEEDFNGTKVSNILSQKINKYNEITYKNFTKRIKPINMEEKEIAKKLRELGYNV